MAYGQTEGRRPFERASKTIHSEIINNPAVKSFVETCTLPSIPENTDIRELVEVIPQVESRITAVVAIDGGMTTTWIREEFPSASIAFMTFGPLLFNLKDLADIDQQTFLAPEDMAKLKNLERFNLVLPTRLVRPKDCPTFATGARKTIQDFLLAKGGDLMSALQWLLFQSWKPKEERSSWTIPQCPNLECEGGAITFNEQMPIESSCPKCGGPVYIADALRLYERIDDELGATAILSYLLTSLEQLVLVHLIRSVWEMKPDLLGEILFVKDGPLAYFGVTAPLHRPMRELMKALASAGTDRPLINLIGLEKSGPFVDHAIMIEPLLKAGEALVLQSSYIYRHVTPGNSDEQEFGRNTYYGSKVIFKGPVGDTYVATVPTGDYVAQPRLEDLYNGTEVLQVTSRLRCSMYDNALVPIALANRLVSLADVPSTEILTKFARGRMETGRES